MLRPEYERIWCRDLSLGGLCRCCRRPVRGRQRVNCSKACREWFQDNHFWGAARWVALDRMRVGDQYECATCGSASYKVEVDHRQRLNGSVRWMSCFNHQSNLQVLCHPCHVAKTTRDGRLAVRKDGTEQGVLM